MKIWMAGIVAAFALAGCTTTADSVADYNPEPIKAMKVVQVRGSKGSVWTYCGDDCPGVSAKTPAPIVATPLPPASTSRANVQAETAASTAPAASDTVAPAGK